MNKEIVQLRFDSIDDERFREVEIALEEYVKDKPIKFDRGFGFMRLSSKEIEVIRSAHQHFEGRSGVVISFGEMRYVSPRDVVNQNGLAVEASEETCLVDLWLEVGPSGGDGCSVEFRGVSVDSTVLERTVQRLFLTNPSFNAPVVGCHVAFTAYNELGTPSRASVEEAVRFAFESAFAKSKPKTMEPTMSVTVSVKEPMLAGMIALINRRRGMIEELDETGELKIVKASIPLAEVFIGEEDFKTLTEGGVFEYEFKQFTVRPENVKD